MPRAMGANNVRVHENFSLGDIYICQWRIQRVAKGGFLRIVGSAATFKFYLSNAQISRFSNQKISEKSQVQNLKHVTYYGGRNCAFPRAHAGIYTLVYETIIKHRYIYIHLTLRRRGRGTTCLAIGYAIINIRRVFSHDATSVHITAKIRTNVLSAKNPDKIRHCGSTATVGVHSAYNHCRVKLYV